MEQFDGGYNFLVELSKDDNINVRNNGRILSFPGVNVSSSAVIDWPQNSERLSESFVEFCDPTDGDGDIYDTASVIFYVNQN